MFCLVSACEMAAAKGWLFGGVAVTGALDPKSHDSILPIKRVLEALSVCSVLREVCRAVIALRQIAVALGWGALAYMIIGFIQMVA